MPRPKGSKNKPTAYVSDEKILKCEKEIEDLQAKLKDKKAELKTLKSNKDKADKQKILDAIESSDKSIDEILALLEGSSRTETNESNTIEFNGGEDYSQSQEEESTASEENNQDGITQDIIE